MGNDACVMEMHKLIRDPQNILYDEMERSCFIWTDSFMALHFLDIKSVDSCS